MRYRLRTLLILLAIGPPMLAGAWGKWQVWRAEQATEEIDRFRHPFSGVIERYDPQTGKSDLEDFMNGKLRPDKH